jgi:hypothetical protein
MNTISHVERNTDSIDEVSYERFVVKQMKQLRKNWVKYNPGEEISNSELREKAETLCGMYKYQFRERKV